MTPIDHTFILACLNQALPMLRNFAAKNDLDAEDLYQDCFFTVYEVLQRDLSHVKHLPGYVQRSIKYAVLNSVRSRVYCASLDAPLGDDTGATLGDMLPDRADPPRDEEDMDKKEAMLYAALRRLPLEEQQYLSELFHLGGYDPVPLYPYRKNKPNRKRTAIGHRAYIHLRSDERLREAVYA